MQGKPQETARSRHTVAQGQCSTDWQAEDAGAVDAHGSQAIGGKSLAGRNHRIITLTLNSVRVNFDRSSGKAALGQTSTGNLAGDTHKIAPRHSA